MRRILADIRDGKESEPYTQPELTAECFAECIDRNYITGCEYIRNANNVPMLECWNPKVTLEGLGFLEGRKPRRKVSIIAIITTVVSIMTVILTVLVDWDYLIENARRIIDFLFY